MEKKKERKEKTDGKVLTKNSLTSASIVYQEIAEDEGKEVFKKNSARCEIGKNRAQDPFQTFSSSLLSPFLSS